MYDTYIQYIYFKLSDVHCTCLLTRSKQLIPDYQTQQYYCDRDKAVFNKKHDYHTDCKPYENEAGHSFHIIYHMCAVCINILK